MEQVRFCDDPLAGLASAATFSQRLAVVHAELQRRCPGVDRMAVALHDLQTGLLKTFAASPAPENPLSNYAAALDQVTSLCDLAAQAGPRVIDDLAVLATSPSQHSRRILGHGYASSFTLPIRDQQQLLGFVFCDSVHKRYFRGAVNQQVLIFTHLTAQLVVNELHAMHTLNAALRTAAGMVHLRDPETGSHLERMAHYSALIARELVASGKSAYDDEQIEQLLNFAPLHDIGKIAIPDRVLLKPARLAPDERALMDTHPLVGRQMIDRLIANFAFDGVPHLDILRQLVEYHHETLDGCGYPHGLKGDEIPLAARIVAVSDVFDALTTTRPYKEPWHNLHAFAMLQLLAIDKLDLDCVQALINRQDDVTEIQRRFTDTPTAA